jgi:radical SAM superfamily enzyme YgiQ (UPF0313 family)
MISSTETFRWRRLNLPLLAALTPPGHKVQIVDEAFVCDNQNEEVDLVGITVMTDLVLRAYQIADDYRRFGTKVVMGGIHPTVLPGEALRHADSVVIGEGELVWAQLLSDAASGQMQKVYRANNFTPLKELPRPMWDLYPKPINKEDTLILFKDAILVEASRGCPYDCEFCSIHPMMGNQYRLRDVQDVIAEIGSIESSFVIFVDDSLALHPSAARKLFNEMMPLRRRWVGEGTVSLAEDLELLKLMRRSGCIGLLVGFESVQKEAQDGMKKIRNLRIDFREAMRRFHGEGISVLGAFVFGFDYEDRDVFEKTFEFIMKHRIDCVQLRILTPYPGTPLHARLLKEGRLFVSDWWLHGYPIDTVLFRPKNMSPEELLDGFVRLNKEVFSFGSIIRRFFGMIPWKRTGIELTMYGGLNLATRNRYSKYIANDQPFVTRSKRHA